MDGNLKYVHVAWIPANPRYALPAGMTGFETLVYNDERSGVGIHPATLPHCMTLEHYCPQLRIQKPHCTEAKVGFGVLGLIQR